MKTIFTATAFRLGAFLCPLIAFGAAEKPSPAGAKLSAAVIPDGGRVIVDVHGLPPPAPVFFSAHVEQTIQIRAAEIGSEMRLQLRVVQGQPEVLTLGLSGDGEIVDVSGKSLRDWSVRQGLGLAAGKRFLDLRLSAPVTLNQGAKPETQDFEFVVRARLRQPAIPSTAALLLLTPGDAVGFASKITLQPDSAVDVRVTAAPGMTPLTSANPVEHEPLRFFSTGDSRLEVKLTARGAAPAEIELTGAQLVGMWNESARTMEFRLRGQLRVQKAGAHLRLLAGRAALGDTPAGNGWRIELVAADPTHFAYDLVGEREGVLPIELTFVAAVREEGDWRTINFTMPAGAVVPVRMEGLGAEVNFKRDATVVPARMDVLGGAGSPSRPGLQARPPDEPGNSGRFGEAAAPAWLGFLPADGVVSIAWRRTREAGEGALFFTSTEQTEVRIAAGLLRQTARLSFRILQGKLPGVRCRVEGTGEILGVEGPNVVGWKVVPDAAGRVLEVQFSRPLETEGALTIRTQAELVRQAQGPEPVEGLGSWPVRVEPMRFIPEGGVRHSGFLRIANSGAVRLEVADATGIMQLAPAQFPGAAMEKEARQVFVYRFPSASYSYRVLATQIQPEVSVSEIATYELADNARIINAALELDVREAPLRDWSLRIPGDYTVVSVEGSDVVDYVAETEAAGGLRVLRVLFGRAIEGRQLLQLRLEKNESAAAGGWSLPALQFPGAKSVRGHVGAVSTPGFRLVPARVDRLVEVPLSFFPRQTAGLQQAWRLREPDWTAELRIEALGQSVQVDVFHLYSLKEGAAYGSVLLNYFVVGAPANEWRVEVPASFGNIDVIGQNVRRDWRREGDQVIVSLHQPVLGAATLLITFEQPMSARGGVIAPGQVRPLGVQSERGFVQVVSPLQVKHEIRRAEGALLKLEPAELPAEFRLLTSSPSLAVYHYTARPFALELNVEWYAPAEMVEQVIEFARLSSQVSRDGQVVTEARFFVKTRGRKALRLVLPAGVQLWEARVDNELVNARADGAQTLVPLPARNNPSEPVTVVLRLGQSATSSGTSVTLNAPRAASAPTVINEWLVRSDPERVLVPQAGNTQLTRPALTETGFEWISTRGGIGTLVTMVLLVAGAFLLRAGEGWRMPIGLLACALAMLSSGVMTSSALHERRPNSHELAYAATIVPAGESMSLGVANVPEWRAFIVGWGVVAAVAGVALLVAARRGGRSTIFPVAGVVLLACGLLAQRGGAVLFFGGTGLAILLRIVVPTLWRWHQDRAQTAPPLAEPGTGAAGAVSLLVIAALTVCALGSRDLRAAQQPAPVPAVESIATPPLPDGTKPMQAIVQRWTIRRERLFAELEVTLRGVPGDSFLLLRQPAVLTDFRGDGLRIGKIEVDGQTRYAISPEREGTFVAQVRFEMPVADRAQKIALPTGPAAAQRITIELDQGGWEFVSPAAVSIVPTIGLPKNRSGATLVLAPDPVAAIELRPRQRDIGAEATHYYVEAANLFVPAPGVVNGFTRITVRPVQGRVTELEFDVPAGLTVGEVSRGPVGAWRFDPQKRRLHVPIEPSQTAVFTFDIETQLGAGELPFALTLQPLRALGAAGEVGTLALAFGGDAQPEAIRTTDLSAVNVQDFEAGLLPRTPKGQPLATVQNVWRYGATGGRLELKIAPVAAEVRVASRQVLSLDDDRMVMSVELRAAISRVGLFKLSFVLPDGLELEALSGPALSHWTEAQEGSQRIVTLHLNGRTIGEQNFNLTLAGAAPGAQAAWAFPRLLVREATRQTGEVLIVPGKGLRLRAIDREKVTQLDPRSIGGQQPGTLAFRLLQEDWVLRIGIEVLDAWVTVQALQEVTLREGQTLTRIALRYRVENAAVKTMRVRLPGLTDDSVRTVRATGSAVSDIVRVADTPDLWEIRFQRGIAGETDVHIEFQSPAARERAQEGIATPDFVGARQVQQFVAVRSGGRLELDAPAIPRGWTRVDWNAVPGHLQQRSERTVPALCFRVAEPESGLTVNVRRHDVADALKLRVTQADLLTLFAPSGAFLTSVELKVDVLEKSTLRVQLPTSARLFNTFVNGESVSVVREGDAFLFYVAPSTGNERAATVRLVYAVATPNPGRRVGLAAPRLSVPLENVIWRVVIPPGYDLDDYSGSLRLRDERAVAAFGLDEYQAAISSKRSADAKDAMSLMQQASSWLQKGEQEKASQALSQVSNNMAIDAASNEDARVQLRNLKTQQTVLGLATRRQRLYLDNRADANRNEQLEHAANLNPLINGGTSNFKPQEFDRLLTGNTAEENSALRTIAARIVDQQLGAEPAPGAIDVTLPERGRVVTFIRSLQVDGAAPLQLNLEIARITRTSAGAIVCLLFAIAAIATIELRRSARL